MALKAVTSRPVEPIMLSQPISVDQLPTPALVLDRPIMGALCVHKDLVVPQVRAQLGAIGTFAALATV